MAMDCTVETQYAVAVGVLSHSQPLSCLECAHLLAEHKHLNAVQAAAFQTFSMASGKSQHVGDCRKLLTIANEAWLDAEDARSKFWQHRRSHI
jgi:hypothetical protein